VRRAFTTRFARGREAQRRFWLPLGVVCVFLCGAAVAQERPWRGPIPVRNARAYNQLALQFMPESPDSLAKGAMRFGAQLDLINNLLAPTARGALVIEDFEEQRLTLSWREGVGRGSEVAVFVPIRYRNGGFMDPLMTLWHRWLSVPGRNRDNPFGRESLGDFHSELLLVDGRGNEHVNVGNAFGLGDVSVTVKLPLARATRRAAAAARIGLKAPTGNPGQVLGSGTFGAGLSLDGRYNVGPWVVFYANLGRVLNGGATRVPGVRRWVNEYLLAAEYRPNRRDSYVLQADGNGVVVATGNHRADESQSTFTVGYRRALDRKNEIHVSFSENGDWNNNTTSLFGGVGPDYTFTLGWSTRR
jgi:hypothetical protein